MTFAAVVSEKFNANVNASALAGKGKRRDVCLVRQHRQILLGDCADRRQL